MDIQSVLIAVSCFVVSAVVIYLITKCSMRERSWEEVKEEQRRQQEAIWKRPPTEKKEKKKKGKGKGVKKEKVEVTSKPTVADEDHHKMVEIEPDPEIIEPPEEIKPIESPKKKQKLKSQLKNKDEHPLVRPGKEAPQLFNKPAKDDLEMKHEHDRRKSQTEEHIAAEIEQAVVQEEVLMAEAQVQQETAPATSATPSGTGKAKKPKKPKATAGNGSGDGSQPSPNADLLDTVSGTKLTDVEIHSLIEVLQVKLGSSGTPMAPSQWTKKAQKGDPLAILTKQLEESNSALQDERQRAAEVGTQVMKLRKEIENERGQLRSKQSAVEEENAALHSRMEQSQQQHMEVVQQLHNTRIQLEQYQKQGAVTQDQTALIQRLQGEIEQLRADRNNAQSAGGLQQQILQQQMERNALTINAKDSEIRKLQETKRDTENVLNRKISELEGELQRSRSHLKTLNRDAEKANRAEQEVANLRNRIKSMEGAEDQLKSLHNSLQEEQRQKHELQGRVQSTETRLRELEHASREKDTRLQALNVEKQKLLTELQVARERTVGEGQESPAAVIREEASSTQAAPPAQENQAQLLKEKEDSISRLQDEVNTKAGELTKLTHDLEAQRKKNNDLREKNWKAMDALNSMEKIAQKSTLLSVEIENKDSLIRSLKEDIQRAKRQTYDLQSNLDIRTSETQTCRTTIKEWEKKYDILQEKTRSLEAKAADRSADAEVTIARMSAVAKVASLQAEMDEKLAHIDRLSACNKALQQEKQQLGATVSQLQSVQEEKDKLQAETQQLYVQIEQMKSEGSNQTSKSEDADERIKALEQQIKDMSIRFHEERNAYGEERKELQASLEEANSAKENLSQEVARLQTDTANQGDNAGSAELQAELRTKTEELASQTQALEQLTVQYAELKELKEKSESEQDGTLSQLKTECEKLQSDLQSQTEAMNKLQEELSLTKAQNTELQASKEQSDTANTEAASALSSQLEELKSQLSTQSEASHKLQDELSLVKKENEELQAFKDAQSSSTESQSALEAEKEQLQSQVSSQSDTLSKIQEELAVVKKENHELRSGCEQATLALTKAERSAEEITFIQAELKAKAGEVHELRAALDARQAQLHSLESEKQAGYEQLEKLQGEVSAKENSLVQLQQQLEEAAQKEHDLQQKLELEMNTSPPKEVTQLEQKLKSEQEHSETLQREVKELSKENTELKAKVEVWRGAAELAKSSAASSQDELLSELQYTLDDSSSQMQELETEVTRYKTRVEELQSKVEELSQLENTVEERVSNAVLGEKEKMVAEGKAQARGTLQKLFPDIDMSETIEESEWITVFEQKVSAYIHQQKEAATPAVSTSELEAQLEESEQARSKLQSQVQHYKTVLGQTEGILNKLQSSVESEEKKWVEKAQKAEDELKQVKEDARQLQLENQRLAAHTEMEDKLSQLEKRLESTEAEKQSLQDQLDQSTQSASSLASQLEEARNTAQSEAQDLAQEVEKVRQTLAAEQKKQKELHSKNVKLNGMLKTGQDALKMEQDLVSKLQSQLQLKSKGLSNGTTPSSEMEELRSKLDQTTQQLAQEQQANKQLAAKLAASAQSEGSAL